MMEYILKSKYEKIDDLNNLLKHIQNDNNKNENKPLIIYLYRNDKEKYIIKTKNNIQCYGEKVFENETLIGVNIPKHEEFQKSDHIFILKFIKDLKEDLENKIRDTEFDIKEPFDKETYNFKTINCKFVKNYDYDENIYFYWKIYDESYKREPLLLKFNEWSQIIKQQKRYNVVHLQPILKIYDKSIKIHFNILQISFIIDKPKRKPVPLP